MDKIKVGLQYWIPQHALTRLVGKLASARAGSLTTAIIRWFIKQYNVNMDEALYSDPTHFKTFNEFFVRELKAGVRPIAEGEKVITHPADACVSQFGAIEDGKLIQAKGHTYSAKSCSVVMPSSRKNSAMAISPLCISRHGITTAYICLVMAHCVK